MYLNLKDAKNHIMRLVRLTLTWDVFKFCIMITDIAYSFRLTLTWDVFK